MIAFSGRPRDPVAAQADGICRWVDEYGQDHYGDRPPPGVPRQLESQPDGSVRRLTEEWRQARIAETEKRIFANKLSTSARFLAELAGPF